MMGTQRVTATTVPAEGESLYTTRRHTRPDYVIDLETGCWVWQKALNRGYPGGRQHRDYWQLANGVKLDPGTHIHHKCRNRACVNPDHLEPIQAMDHFIEHRVGGRGQTIQDVLDIREAGKDPNVTAQQLAEKYGITANNIWYIWTARSWSHLGGPVRPPSKPCPNCGDEVFPKPRHKRFCSQRCQQNYNARSPERRAAANERQRKLRAKRAA